METKDVASRWSPLFYDIKHYKVHEKSTNLYKIIIIFLNKTVCDRIFLIMINKNINKLYRI